jgi:hypothetical protein
MVVILVNILNNSYWLANMLILDSLTWLVPL